MYFFKSVLPLVLILMASSLVQAYQTQPREEEFALLDPDEEETADRDRYNLYDRNRDRSNWNIRENWRYQKEAWYGGTTRINPYGPGYQDNGSTYYYYYGPQGRQQQAQPNYYYYDRR